MNLIRSSRVLQTVGVMCLVAGAGAQTPPATTTNPCPSDTPPVLAAFAVERVQDIAQVLSTVPPILPASLATAVQNKVAEIHESIVLTNQTQVLTLNLYPMQTGSPIPTPPNGVIPGSVFSTVTLSIEKIYTTCTPSPSVRFVGTIVSNSSLMPFGNITGAPATVSVGLTNDNPPKITNVVVLVTGIAVAYSPTGAGTITFAMPSVTPPGQAGSGPAIVVNTQTLTTVSVVDLDASATTGQNRPLTFKWTATAGAADIANSTAAKATGYILGGVGSYTFRVTVTDSKGIVSTKDIIVQYL